jgi:2-(1,2-epoxy-1,2-dihydrophenyl)acetyl-CoA isomerase
MTSAETVGYSVASGVAVLTLNRPAKRNAFNRALRVDLLAALKRAREDSDVRIIVLTGAGQGFCAGADLAEARSRAGEASASQIIANEYRPIIEEIRSTPKLVVAAVNGAAAGIGSAVVLACDLIVMAEHAYLLQAFADIGLVPDGGITWFLARAVGVRLATELMLDPSPLGAKRCLELGLVNRVVPADRLLDETLDWSRSLAQRATLPQSHVKLLMHDIFDISLGEAIGREAMNQDRCAASPDFQEGITAFLEKRQPVFGRTAGRDD